MRTELYEKRKLLSQLQSINDDPKLIEQRAVIQDQVHQLQKNLRDLMKHMIDNAALVLTTVSQVSMEDALWDGGFDTVVADEASMMSAPHILTMALPAKKRLVIAGDFKQLGPIAMSQSKSAYTWLKTDLFKSGGVDDISREHPARKMLTTQRRMHEGIARLVNKSWYRNMLRTEVTPESVSACQLSPYPGNSVVFMDIRNSTVQSSGTSRKNEKTAESVARIARKLLKQKPAKIGIIVPYRAQAKLLREKLEDILESQENREGITIGTIHAYQGSEADVIIWDLVDAANMGVGRLYHKDKEGERLCNVAMSRAKEKLIIVGDEELFKSAHQVGELKRMLGRREILVVS